MEQLGEIILLAVIVLVIDLGFLWSMRNYFNGQIRAIQGTNMSMNYLAAGLCYVVIIACLYKFIILPGASILDAAMLGWSVYLIYELTNKALFNSWEWQTVLIDGVWGGILFASSTYIYQIIKSKF
jgi:uncharacterized membrane protein